MIPIQFHSLKDTDFIFTKSFYVCDAMQLYLRTYHYFLGGEGGEGEVEGCVGQLSLMRDTVILNDFL